MATLSRPHRRAFPSGGLRQFVRSRRRPEQLFTYNVRLTAGLPQWTPTLALRSRRKILQPVSIRGTQSPARDG